MGVKKEIKYEINPKGCWIVTSHKPNPDGYIYKRVDGKHVYLHRYTYEQEKGSIPKNMVVRHTCDNPTCINSDHLILGSQKDNVEDRFIRNRSAKGSANGSAKLNEEDIKKIRSSTLSQEKLAKEYNVGQSTIWHIKNNRTWQHVR